MKLRHFIAVFVVVLAGYPLSFGPAMGVYSRSRGTPMEAKIEAFYTPLFWAMDHSQLLSDMMLWYEKPWEYRPNVSRF